MDAQPKIRLDKWLWQARFFKTRGLSSETITKGRVRVDGVRVVKPGRPVAIGSVLTFVQGDRVRVVRILDLGERRGPASEAQQLYEDIADED